MKSKKIKKILIIGLGAMGRSHFLSFYKKNYLIDLCDKKISNLPLKMYHYDKKINFLKSIPQKKSYDLAIISTNSKERLKVLKDLYKTNKIKYLLLEKFLFSKKKEYLIFSRLIKKYNIKNIRVNTWGSFLVKKLSLKKLIVKNIHLDYKLLKGSLGTNLIHILDLFYSLIRKKEIYFLERPLKIINSKRKGYHEIVSDLEIYNEDNTIRISDNDNKKYHILSFKKNNDKYEIYVNKSSMCILCKNKIQKKSIKFPYAKYFTEPFFKKCYMKKANFNNYGIISKLSIQVLNFVQKKKKNVLLT